MRKKILLLFSIIVLCIPLARAQFDHAYMSSTDGSFNKNLILNKTFVTKVTPQSISFNNSSLNLVNSASTLDKNVITQNFRIYWETKYTIRTSGYLNLTNGNQSSSTDVDERNYSSKRATVSMYGIMLNGTETKIKTFPSGTSGSINYELNTDDLKIVKRYNKIRISIDLDDVFTDSELGNFHYPKVENVKFSKQESKYYIVEFDQSLNDLGEATISNSGTSYITLTGEPDTKVTGASSSGNGGTTNHSLSVSQMGTGTVLLSECNLTNINFALSDVDFYCQSIKSIVLQDANGNVKKTFPTSDYRTIGTANIEVSMLNVTSIADNDKLVLALTNSCTTGKETDYTIILRTEGLDKDNKHSNSVLYPNDTKVPIAIAQKAGSKWCDNSSAFFFNVSGANGYTDINFTNATADGASWSVAKGQTQIVGTAQFGKCFTSVTVPIPTINQPKVPVIGDAEYCNGSSLNFAIKNPTDYSTETFRLLLDNAEKVGWQGTKVFNGINLGKVGEATAVVEATNGECSATSSTAKITSRVQPISPTFSGATSYYTEQGSTTLTLSNAQAGVTYKIYKDGATTPSDTWINSKPLTLTKGSYRVTGENDNALCTAETTVVVTEKYLNIGTGWVTTDLSFCQLDGTKDLNSFVTFNAASSVTFTSTAGLSISGSNVNLATSTAGTYTITCTAIKDGITKVFNKSFTVKAKANDIALALVNATDFSCNQDAAQIQVTTDYPGYTYSWTKGGTALSETTRTITNTLTKQEGSQAYVVTATATNGCKSTPSAALTLTKNYLTTDVAFITTPVTYCQSIGGKVAISDLLSGSDKVAVSQEQSGYTYTLTPSSSDMVIINRSQIDLERTKAGTYTITMVYTQNGCSKTISKQIVIKQKPETVTLVLENASTIECDGSNANALLRASHNAYTYDWYKKGVKVDGMSAQSASIPVAKADGLTSIYAIPILDGCSGTKTNEVSLTKRFVEANLSFSSGSTEYCQKTGGTVDLFTELSGTDKVAVSQQQSGYTWALTPSGSGLKINGSLIDLQTSQAGTYTVSMAIMKDGCSKTITKDIMIRQRPADFTISQTNSTDFSCNNSAAALSASVTSYTYRWYKGSTQVGAGTSINIPIVKDDKTNVSRTIYAIGTAENGCETNPSAGVIAPLKTFLEADIQMSAGKATFCQSTTASKADIFDFLSGADKIAVTTKQHYDWTITAPALALASPHEIDLLAAQAGTYTITFSYRNDEGCAKTLTKEVVIKSKPSIVSIALENISTIECDGSNPNALVKAENSAYAYDWYKKGVKVDGMSAQSASIPVAKAEGLTSIYAIPILDGCAGTKTNEVSITKRFVEANLALTDGVGEYCQTVGTTLDIRTLLSGADKDKIVNEQDSYTWDIKYSSTGLLFLDSKSSVLNLEKSFPQTYTTSMNIHRDGCSKTISKEIKIKPRPIEVEISMLNGDNIACNQLPVQFKAAIPKYEYKWLSNDKELTEKTAALTLPIQKTDGLISVYAIPILDGCAGTKTNTITTQKFFIECNLAFSTTKASYCQSLKSKFDIFTELSGTDKLAVQTKQNGWDWKFSSSSADLIIVGNEIDLEKSKAGTYTVSMDILKDGCSKTITKEIVINPMPVTVSIVLENASSIECDGSNPNALVKAENSAYTYEWYKKGVKVDGMSAQSASIPVAKADGLTPIYAIPFMGTCAGVKTNEVSLTKRFVEADLAFNATEISCCQKDKEFVDLFATHLSGKDKASIQGKQNGWDWKVSAPSSLVVKDGVIDLQNSSAGSYDLNLILLKDGCEKVLKLTVVIKAQPGNISLTLVNATDFSCNQDAAVVEASVKNNTYEWYKNGAKIEGKAAKMVIPILKTDNLSKLWAVGISENGCASRNSDTISVVKHFVECNLAFSTTKASYCQSLKSKFDIFTELSGTDKLAVQTKQNGWDWKFSSSSADLIIVGNEIDLEKSKAGTYTISLDVLKDGCSKTITKEIVINPMPSAITIEQIGNVTCNKNSATFRIISTENNSYNWYKNTGLAIQNKDKQTTLAVTKADGLTSFYVVPITESGCIGVQSNTIQVQKKNVEVDFGFNDKTIAVPSKDETLNLFDYTVGKDKDVVINQTSGYTYKFAFNQVKQTKLDTTDGTITPATGIHSGDTQYLLNVTVCKDGCDSIYTKAAIIKAIPRNITIDFAQKKELQECTNNNIINVVASDSNLKYKWYKNDVQIPNISSASAAIEVFKSDQEVKIYAIPMTSEGVEGYKTNNLLTTKRYISADLQLDSKSEVFCSEAGKKVNIFDYVRGADKESVLNGKYGFSYITTGDCGLSIADNKYIDFDNSLSDDAITYNVALTISQNGCSTTQTKALTIKKRPEDITIELMSKASNTADKNLFCGGDSLYLKASSSATGAVFNWYKDGGLIKTTPTPNFNYKFNDAVGTINLSATLSYQNGCQSTRSNVITVNKKDVTFDIDMSSDAIAYCPEQKKVNLFDYVSGSDKANVVQQNNNCSYEFVASGNNGLAIQNYSFLDLDNSTSSQTPYTLTFNVNKDGCKKSFSKNISIKPRPITPVISLTSNNELRFCGNDAVSFADANKNSGNTYKWLVNGTQVSGQEGTLNYNTAQSGNLSVQTIAYLTTNSCASKVSNILNVINVRPLTEVKLIRDKVTLNETIQFYVFESSTPSKNIKLTGVRTSDQSVFDLMYSRDGNVITLKGMLPIGEYTITGVAENTLPGYCSTDINVSSKLTVIKSTSNTAGNLATKSEEEIARKKIYDEYMAQLKSGEVRSILFPISTSSDENANLCIFSVDENDYANIYVLDGQGKEVSRRTEYLNKGENNFTIEANQKPSIAGLYLVKIEYSKSRRVETLKALIK